MTESSKQGSDSDEPPNSTLEEVRQRTLFSDYLGVHGMSYGEKGKEEIMFMNENVQH